MTFVTLRDMREHVRTLCEKYEIACYEVKRPNQAYAIREGDVIGIALIRSAITYATALHEIGHHRGNHQNSRGVMVRERWAWQWARSEALIWTPAMERSAQKALQWYVPRAAKMDRKRAHSESVQRPRTRPKP